MRSDRKPSTEYQAYRIVHKIILYVAVVSTLHDAATYYSNHLLGMDLGMPNAPTRLSTCGGASTAGRMRVLSFWSIVENAVRNEIIQFLLREAPFQALFRRFLKCLF